MDYWRFLMAKIYPVPAHRPAAFEFVYLTIDRDCMKDNQNQRGDNKAFLKNHEEVSMLADAIIALTRSFSVVCSARTTFSMHQLE